MKMTNRTCCKCGKKNIPRGIDWPFWREGKPVCRKCEMKLFAVSIRKLFPV